MKPAANTTQQAWPDYAAIWRWHFYAGLFCLPFFCWLAITGSAYLFRPDIEAWLDHPYEALHLEGPRAAPSSEARAAVAAVPGSVFSRYEPAATRTGAAQIVVAHDGHLYRVYVHPVTLRAMKIERDDHRIMELVAHLHGQLLLGNRGSMLVELAGSWGIVMIVTGLYLWLPRSTGKLAGLLYPRLRQCGRFFWRDLHAVTGLWISIVTLLLLLSGLPWSASWGNYLTWVRNHWVATTGTPDWPIGVTHHTAHLHGPAGPDLHALDKLVPVAAHLQVPRPIWISPPAQGVPDWTISSQIQNRPLRVTYTVNPATADVTGTKDFADENIVDKVVNVAIATHEGQLFGRLNQAILLLNAIGVLLVSISAVVMWWRRRPADTLGAPPPMAPPRFSALLVVVIVALAVLLPLFGLSLLLVLGTERLLLRYFPAARRWLGLPLDPG